MTPNPIGLQDFCYFLVVNIPTKDANVRTIYNKADAVGVQIRLSYSNGVLTSNIGGNIYTSSLSKLESGVYKIIFKRVSGTYEISVNDVVDYSGADATSLVSRAYSVFGAQTTDGTTFSNYFNGGLLSASYNNGDNITGFISDENKFCAKEYGL